MKSEKNPFNLFEKWKVKSFFLSLISRSEIKTPRDQEREVKFWKNCRKFLRVKTLAGHWVGNYWNDIGRSFYVIQTYIRESKSAEYSNTMSQKNTPIREETTANTIRKIEKKPISQCPGKQCSIDSTSLAVDVSSLRDSPEIASR